MALQTDFCYRTRGFEDLASFMTSEKHQNLMKRQRSWICSVKAPGELRTSSAWIGAHKASIVSYCDEILAFWGIRFGFDVGNWSQARLPIDPPIHHRQCKNLRWITTGTVLLARFLIPPRLGFHSHSFVLSSNRFTARTETTSEPCGQHLSVLESHGRTRLDFS